MPVPPPAEQRRIAAKLDSLIARTVRARTELERVPHLVEKFKTALLDSALQTAEATATRTVPLGEIASEVRNGVSRRPEDHSPGIPILKISAVRPMTVRLDERRYYIPAHGEDVSHYLLRRGDLLFTRYNGNAELVAACGMIYALDEQLIYPDKLIRVRVDERSVLPEFVELLASSQRSRDELHPFIKSAAGQHGISGADLKRLPLPLPSLTKQRQIVDGVHSALTWLDRLVEEQSSAGHLISRLDERILAKAFRGELVPQDRSDEPASVLLDRIRAAQAGTSEKTRRRRSTPSDKRADAPPMLEAAEPEPSAYVPERVNHAPHAHPLGTIEIDRTDLICRIRRVFGTGGAREREDAIRELAKDLGAQRVGSRIREELENGIRTAVRRGVLEADGTELRLAARMIDDYDRDFLKGQFLASLGGHGWTEREDALVQFTRWMGYGRIGAAIEDKVRSLIHGLLLERRLESEGTRIRKI
jgi:type I restriction enzyme S subunit